MEKASRSSDIHIYTQPMQGVPLTTSSWSSMQKERLGKRYRSMAGVDGQNDSVYATGFSRGLSTIVGGRASSHQNWAEMRRG